MWWSYNHQDEWLFSEPISCPSNAYLRFDTYAYYGSNDGDHYYVKISLDGGLSWEVLWDASALAGGWNYYEEPVWIDLRAYEGMQITLAWHADDPPTNDGMRYQWFIDNISIFSPEEAPVLTLNKSQSRYGDRTLIGYRVYRLQRGEEDNPQAWSLLTPQSIQANAYTDMGFINLPMGIAYRYAILALYENDLLSPPTYSNTIIIPINFGHVAGVVRNTANEPIAGALISTYINETYTNNAGAYYLTLPQSVWDITASKDGYISQTMSSVVVMHNVTITLNFTLTSTSATDTPHVVYQTELKGNNPNPFGSSTNIHYSVKDKAAVEIIIYNARGQRVKSFHHKPLRGGEYSIAWDGRADDKCPLASGIYFCVMQSGSYRKSMKMLYLK